MKMTFNKSKRVTIDGNLAVPIPNGFHYGSDGFGGNQNWFYIVPNDYPLELDHIDAKPLSFGITKMPVFAFPESINKKLLDGVKRFLLDNNALQQGEYSGQSGTRF